MVKIHSVRIKLTLLMLLIVGIALTVAFFVITRSTRQHIGTRLNSNFRLESQLVSSLVYCHLEMNGDSALLVKAIEEMAENEYVAHIRVENRNGKTIAHGKNQTLECPDFPPTEIAPKNEKGCLHFDTVFASSGDTLGAVHIAYSFYPSIALVNKIKRNAIILSVSLLMLGALLVFRVQQSVLKPVARLKAAIAEISQSNDYTMRVKKIKGDEIGALYDSFNMMLDRIEYYVTELRQNNQYLEEFSFVASHDLREPLRTLTSYCELLREDLGPTSDEAVEQDITYIVEAASRMNSLILDLLELSRASRGEYAFTSVDLNEVLHLTTSDLKTAIEEKKASVSYVGLPLVYGDQTHLIRVFSNLISNAIKFNTSSEPRVRIKAEDCEGYWVISVEDNGIGIDERFHDAIFAPFKRLHGASKYPGSGIGLAICRKIIEKHQGKIWIESVEHVGSKVFFTLQKAES